MKKAFLIPLALTMLFMGSQVFALTIDVYQATDTSSINGWVSNLGGNVTVLEDFEDLPTGWYQTIGTSVGNFTAGGEVGIGDTSYQQNGGSSTNPYFSIRDTAWYGRGNTTDGGSNYLDSGDITELSLDLSVSVSNLFFFLQDPSDVNATTTIDSEAATVSFIPNFANGSLWFIGISANTDLQSVSWRTTNQNDGYGVDDFSTVTPVPEPATMLLLGAGIIGLAGFRRKKYKK